MGSLHGILRCGRKRRFEEITQRLDFRSRRTWLGLFDCRQSRVPLPGRGHDRVQIFVGEQDRKAE